MPLELCNERALEPRLANTERPCISTDLCPSGVLPKTDSMDSPVREGLSLGNTTV